MTAKAGRGAVGRFEAMVLENDHARAVILPELGGRVWELEDRARGRQWIWHRDDITLEAHPVGSSYDDVWAGGWEELFPNDAAGEFEGRALPDHGEWWASPWSATVSTDATGASVSLSLRTKVIEADCRKVYTLSHDEPTLSVRYTIHALETKPFHFLLKQHLPVAITSDCRLILPGGRAEAVDPNFGTLLEDDEPFAWPAATGPGSPVDMRLIPARSSQAREFVYVRDLTAAWCGVDDLAANASLRMHFDSGALPFVWLFLTYGGWRDLYTAVLEPCTNMPKDLSEAVRLGQSAVLDPGSEFTTGVEVELTSLRETPA